MSSAIRSLRFLPISDSKNRQRYSSGELFYDREGGTLRIYDGVTPGGFKLATEQFVQNNQNLQDIDSDITPGVANTYDLGSPTKPWRSLYVSTNTIYIGGTAVGVNNGQLTVGTDGTSINLATEDYVNNQGFITTAALYWNNISSKPTFASVATSGRYTDLTNKPTTVSSFTNDSGYITSSALPTNLSDLTNDAGFITAEGQTAQVQADWNQSSTDAVDYIKNKPTIPSLTGYATETYVNTAVANLVDAAPATLDTLNELANALGDNPNYATSITEALGNKEPTITAGTTSQYWRGDKTWQTLNATAVGLGNVTNESKSTMFTNPTFTDSILGANSSGNTFNFLSNRTGFQTLNIATGTLTDGTDKYVYIGTGPSNAATSTTEVHIGSTTSGSFTKVWGNLQVTGTVSGVTATHVGLGNVTNESKSTMFASPTFTGNVQVNGDLSINNNDIGTLSLGPHGIGIENTADVPNMNFGFRFRGFGGSTLLSYDMSNYFVFNNNVDFIKYGPSDTPTVRITGGTGVSELPGLYVNGITSLQQTTEVFNIKTGATGVVAHNFLEGAIWYHSSISANFTANFTNIPSTFNRATVCTLILQQGSTGYIPNAVQLDGTPYLINWLGGSAPSGNANKIDIVSFTLIKPTGSNFYVMGSLSTYG